MQKSAKCKWNQRAKLYNDEQMFQHIAFFSTHITITIHPSFCILLIRDKPDPISRRRIQRQYKTAIQKRKYTTVDMQILILQTTQTIRMSVKNKTQLLIHLHFFCTMQFVKLNIFAILPLVWNKFSVRLEV